MPAVDHALASASELLSTIGEEALAALFARAGERQLAAREVIFRQGEEARAILLLASGRAKLTQLSGEGEEIVLRLITPGDCIGAVAALERNAYPVTATAVCASRALVWPRAVWQELVATHHDLASGAMHVMSARLRELQERLRELATERVAQRVARTLGRLAVQVGRPVAGGIEIDLPASRQTLAEMAGTTLFTVSRQLGEWQELGLVRCGRERVLILDLPGLERCAETPSDRRSSPLLDEPAARPELS